MEVTLIVKAEQPDLHIKGIVLINVGLYEVVIDSQCIIHINEDIASVKFLNLLFDVGAPQNKTDSIHPHCTGMEAETSEMDISNTTANKIKTIQIRQKVCEKKILWLLIFSRCNLFKVSDADNVV